MKKNFDPLSFFVFGGLLLECIGLAGCVVTQKLYNHISKKEEN